MRLLGSTLFNHNWKVRTTPSGRSILALRSSARRTCANDFISWPTPIAGPQNGMDSAWKQRREECKARHGNNGFGLTLGMASQLTNWATPAARDWKDGRASQETMEKNSRPLNEQVVQLAGWPTPRTSEASHPGRQANTGHTGQTGLAEAYSLAHWPTSNTPSGGPNTKSTPTHTGGMDLDGAALLAANGPARLTATGHLLTGSCAQMESGGQLNPRMSAWLMGLPPNWDIAALAADIPSTRSPKKAKGGR